MQLTLFPLLGRKYFTGLSAGPTATWTNKSHVKAAIIPGASGFAGSAPLILIHQTGTLDQQGGTYRNATEKANVAYDPVHKVPASIDEVRTHVPQRSAFNNDTIQLKLTKLSPR